MTSFTTSTQKSRVSIIKLGLVALCCALIINGVLIVILHKLQQTEVKTTKRYDLNDINLTKVSPQRLKLLKQEIQKPKKKIKRKPKLMKKRIIAKKPPPVKPMVMKSMAFNMNMRLLPMPHLSAVVIPDPVVEAPPMPDLPPSPDPGDDGIYDLDMVDKPPQPLVRSAPIYPVAAKRLGIEGWVDVAFVVDEAGKVIEVDIADSSSRRFHQSAQSAVYTWRFKPAKKDGKNVSVLCRQKLTFEMQN